MSNSDDTQILVAQAVDGDANPLSLLMDHYRERLKRMVGLRMDRRLQGRVDASDVVQEALIEAARSRDEFAANPPMGFFLWLRWLTGERLLNPHRQHLGTQKRDAGQEVSLYRRALPEASSVSIAHQLLRQLTSPTQAVVRAELRLIVQEVLNSMDPIDRPSLEHVGDYRIIREIGRGVEETVAVSSGDVSRGGRQRLKRQRSSVQMASTPSRQRIF